MDKIPDQLGVFPLPHVVLFPHALLPLHVFEPRYRALLQDALDGSRRFVLSVLKPGYEDNYDESPEVYEQACVGKIVEHELLPDGCSDIIVQGERVVKIEEFVSEKPFRTAKIRVDPRDDSFAEGSGAEERVRELHELVESACPGCLDALRARTPADLESRGGLTLLHTIAMHLPVDVELKVKWLSQPGSLARWKAVRETLRELSIARTNRSDAIRRYSDLQPENPRHN